MTILTLLLLAVALGTDAFSLSIAIGIVGVNRRQLITISVTVLLFHIIMPLTGYFAGEIFGQLVGKTATIAGAIVLIFLGSKMMIDTFREEAAENNFVITNFWGIVLLAGSVSLDALSVGFSLGTQRFNLTLVALTFGIVAGIMTFLGLNFGRKVGQWIGEKAALAGGAILIGIGFKLFL